MSWIHQTYSKIHQDNKQQIVRKEERTMDPFHKVQRQDKIQSTHLWTLVLKEKNLANFSRSTTEQMNILLLRY